MYANWQQLVGLAFLMVGLVSVSSYSEELSDFRVPFFYRELAPMRERWGETVGTVLHVLSYVVAPLGFGIIFLLGFVFR